MAEKMTKIGCRLSNGLRLRVSDWVDNPEGGKMLREVATYDLAGHGAHSADPADRSGIAYTEVPAEHWALWAKQNEANDLITGGTVFESGSDPLKLEDTKAAKEAPAEPGPSTNDPAPATGRK